MVWYLNILDDWSQNQFQISWKSPRPKDQFEFSIWDVREKENAPIVSAQVAHCANGAFAVLRVEGLLNQLVYVYLS